MADNTKKQELDPQPQRDRIGIGGIGEGEPSSVSPPADIDPEPGPGPKACELTFLVKISIEPFCGCQQPPQDGSSGGGRGISVRPDDTSSLVQRITNLETRLDEELRARRKSG